MKKLKFYRCPVCGNIVVKLVDSKVPLTCCGQPMQEIKPNKVDAALEKHVPVVSVKGNKVVVNVGSVAHPMEKKHLITHIVVVTNLGYYTRVLSATDQPTASYTLQANETLTDVYAYCNLHNLWSAKL